MSGTIDKILQFIRPKRDITAFHSVIGNPFVWVALTILFLAIAFFMLQPLPEQTDNIDENRSTADKQTFSKIRIDAPRQIALGNDEDLTRAEAFRVEDVLETHANKWITQAEELINAGQLVEPEGYNAWFAYQQVLNIDPKNHKAIAGLGNIETIIYENIEQSYNNEDFELTEFWIDKFKIIRPDDPFIAAVRAQIETRINELEQQQQAKALAAQRALLIEQLLEEISQLNTQSPYPRDKIIALYQEIREIDADFDLSNAEIKPLINASITDIQQLINETEFEQARELLNKLNNLFSDNPELAGISITIDEAAQAENQRQESELARAESILNAENNSSDSILQQTEPNPAPPPNELPVNSALENERVLIQDKTIARSDAQRLRDAMQAFYIRDNYAEAARLFAPLARNNNIRAQFYLGLIDRYIVNTEIDNDVAQTWINTTVLQLLELAHQGVASAQFDVGLAYDYGISFRRDEEIAQKWYERARSQGYSLDKNQLSRFFPRSGLELKK